ncbi:MAG: hypothetical protein KAW12_14900 [Candidatus Aminicenantes bacterium]|nr:hypothetical protein [Candidatus Aminicenantes bacterium]
MKKTIFFVLTALFLCGALLPANADAGEEKKKDTLEISALKAEPDIVFNGITGMRITFHAKIDKKESSAVPLIYAVVFDKNNRPVKAALESSNHNINGSAGCEKSGFILRNPVKMFIPYYVPALPQGKQQITIKISGAIRYGISDPQPLKCSGETCLDFSINKPGARKFRVMAREIRVDEKNLHDNNWDSGGGRGRLPDLRYKVVLGSHANRDMVYASPVVKNSLSAGWVDFSGEITVSAEDIITIIVCDKDTMVDDPIGRLKRNVDDLKKIADSKKKIHFGLVNTCLLDIENQ